MNVAARSLALAAGQNGSLAPSHRSGWHPLHALRLWHRLVFRTQPVTAAARCVDSAARGKDALFRAGDDLLRRLAGDDLPVSVVVFDVHDLPELACVFGAPVAKEAIARATASFRRITGPQGLVLRIEPTTFTLLLPGIDGDQAKDLIAAEFGRSCCLEIDADGEEIVLLLERQVKTVDDGTLSLKRIYECLCRDITQARLKEQARQNYLERERESHTRPMELHVANSRTAGKPPARARAEIYPPIPPTMPVPMARR